MSFAKRLTIRQLWKRPSLFSVVYLAPPSLLSACIRVDLSLYSKQRNAGKIRLNESTLLNRIHKNSFGGLGADTLTFTSRLLLYPFPGFSERGRVCIYQGKKPCETWKESSNYFHEEYEKSWKLVPFSWILHCVHGMSRLCESTRKKVDLVVITGICFQIILNTSSGVFLLYAEKKPKR